MSNNASRAKHEIEHGKMLAQEDTERLWGWGTPAGRLRAQRRGTLIAAGACLKPGMRVLEIGCGTGLFTEMFAKTGAELVAVDISPELLEAAKKRHLPENQVKFLEKRFEDCDVEGPFDAIIGSSILHHLELESALSKIYSLLKPGGIMSFAEPNMLNPQVFIMFKFRRWFPEISPDENAFIRWRLAHSLEKTGFEIITLTPIDWLHPAVPKPLIPVIRSIGKLLELTPVLCEFSGSLCIQAHKPN
ncbi:MAG: methyltransferase domain-containing protein [Thiomargarita sp.]|nr:methyltransferase domain-containing protein [Thiomargarita sp.]